VSVAHATAVDDVGHLHAGAQLVLLNLHGEDGHGRSFHVIEDCGGHVGEGARRKVFEDEGVEGAGTFLQLGSDGGGDGFSDAVGDEGDFFVGLDAEAGEDGGAGAGRELRGKGLREQVRCGGGGGSDRGAPVWAKYYDVLRALATKRRVWGTANLLRVAKT